MRKYAWLFLAFIFTNGNLFGQRPNSFSNDPNVFIVELESFMRSGNGETKDEVENFAANYNTGKFSVGQKQQMVKLCNTMLQNQMLVNTDFYTYIKIINAFVSGNQMLKFDNWHKTVSGAIKNNKTEFYNFLKISKNIFVESILLQVGNSVWEYKATDIDFVMEDQATFVFKSLDLFCYSPGDTLDIAKTSGKFYAGTNIFVGKGGRTDWSRVGLNSFRVYAMLNKYTINLTNGLLEADSALLYYKDKFNEPLVGKFTDKSLSGSQGEKSIYPQFVSNSKAFTGITFGKAKYKGGFGLKGATIMGKSYGGQKAELYFSFKNKPIFRVASDEFFIKNDKVVNDNVELTIFLDKDSIYHPHLRFNYLVKDDKISLYRDNKMGISNAPFLDYFHNIEIYVDEMIWDINNPKITLRNIAGDDPVKFQSINYFRDIIYEKLQGMLDYNPLQRIKTYCEKYKINSFNIESYTAAFKSNLSDIKLQMIDLNDKGFLNYNEETKIVTIKPKLKDYVNVHMGRTDYDAISFKSVISAIPNAALSLINNDLIVQGVGKFKFSDSQNVEITPREQVLTIKKNRTIEFNGKLRAGVTDFFGSNFTFDYTKFDVRLNNVDSMKFLYFDDSLNYTTYVKSVIQNIYGNLEIDYPYNKSGRRFYPGYPKFTSEVGSKVYYDYPTTQKGNYVKERFYFDVDPFKLDSLNDLNLYTLALKGTFVSDGIVPDMKQEIYLQPDKSLGFFVPNDTAFNYLLYKGKGTAKMDLRLSNEGLIGSGEIVYLASKSTSKRFNFLLDSMNADCETFKNDRTALFPTVINSKNVYNHWVPYQDTMFIFNKGEPIKISYDRAELRGILVLTPNSMKAKGSMKIEDGELIADWYELRPVEILSTNAIFRQRYPNDTSRIGFETQRVNAYVNLEEKYGEFTYDNPYEINNDFILNMYQGSFEKLRWNMIPRTLEFKGKTYEENPKKASYLQTKKASQDNLTFKTANVKLELGDYTLVAQKIPFINILDSKVIPDSGQVIIREAAEMDELKNAKIKSDTVNYYHSVEQVSIKINGRTNVKGEGNYIYTDKYGRKQRFYLSEIYPEDKFHLSGKTVIPDSIGFTLNPKIAFRGNVNMYSYNKHLEYNGFFKATHNLYLPKSDWFKATADISPDTIYLELKPPLANLNRQMLYCGMNVSADSTHVYPAMFTRKRSTTDVELFKVDGFFTYDEKFNEYRIGPFSKLFENYGQRTNVMIVNEVKRNISAEGMFNFGFDAPRFKIPAAGSSNFTLNDTAFVMRLAMVLNFTLPSNAIKLMADSIINQSSNASNDYFDRTTLNIALPHLLDEKTALKLGSNPFEEINGELINSLKKTFFITNIFLRWNQATRSFISVGDFGVKSIDKNIVERKLQGRLEIKKGRTSDEVILYLQQNNGSWYYFKYVKGNLSTLSSDIAYNEAIKQGLDKATGEGYTLRQASISDRNKLVRTIKGK